LLGLAEAPGWPASQLQSVMLIGHSEGLDCRLHRFSKFRSGYNRSAGIVLVWLPKNEEQAWLS